jgi:hypothetical protein
MRFKNCVGLESTCNLCSIGPPSIPNHRESTMILHQSQASKTVELMLGV